jgi:hypothetical protein
MQSVLQNPACVRKPIFASHDAQQQWLKVFVACICSRNFHEDIQPDLMQTVPSHVNLNSQFP